MKAVLGRKQSIANKDWLDATKDIEALVSKEELDTLVKETVQDIREKTEGKKVAFAWSGGKESQVLELLTISILVNGFTVPIVRRPDNTIIDGFHRWTVTDPSWKYVPVVEGLDKSDKRTLFERLGGKVPVVTVEQEDKAMYVYGTVTHNRARGTHLLEPMKAIVKRLLEEGKTIDEIGKQLGMKSEEIFRLSDFSKDDFLRLMVKNGNKFSKAEYITKI